MVAGGDEIREHWAVPTKAGFEEKTFEGAANLELARDRGRVFTPGQVEEGILGYDAAALPSPTVAGLLNRVAGITTGPGVWLTPNWWLRCPHAPPPSFVPSRFASLLLQYKRPNLHFSPTDELFAAHGGAYFRFAFRAGQHKTLVRLDEALNDEAIVRYAAPCTIERKELEQWQIDGSVLENTNFVSPRRIGLRHKGWTYSSPGGLGFRNETTPGDEPIETESADRLFGLVRDRPGADAALGVHLFRLLRLIDDGDLNARVDAAVEEFSDRGSDGANGGLAAVLRLRLVGLALANAGVEWWLYEL